MLTRPAACAATLAVLTLAIPTTLDLFTGRPVPGGHDEASYSLAGDTFASGRLANPTHLHWHHFETFHVIHEPTYVSKFPPMQGLFLAAGQVVSGQQALGIRLGTAFMCAAMFWMLLAWVPPRWALLGSVVAVLQLGVLGYWAHSYWGGAVAAGGGALVFGSVRRLYDKPDAGQGLLLALGLAVLANSRPFEGLLLGVIGLLPLAWALATRDGRYRRALILRAVPVSAVALGLVALAMAYYFWRTTGSPLRMPYQVYEETYSFRSFQPWNDLGEMPDYRHDIMREFYVLWGDRPTISGDPLGFVAAAAAKLGRLYWFYLGVLGLLPVLALTRIWRDPWLRYAVGVIVVVVAATLFTSAYPHYVAPVTGLILFVAIQATRDLMKREPGTKARRLAEITLVLFGAAVLIRGYLHIEPLRPSGFIRQRLQVERRLLSAPGEHLVLVRYGDRHLFHSEWVSNGADIDASRIVWARDIGDELNRDLLDYYDDRTVWLLEASRPEEVPLAFKEEVVRLCRHGRAAAVSCPPSASVP